MIAYIGIGVMVLAVVLGVFDLFSQLAIVVLFLIGLLALVLLILAAHKFEERKLIASYAVLPIVPGVYAIKTCDGNVIFKYIDTDDEDKVLIDMLVFKNEIEEIEDDDKPVLKVYEQKAKQGWFRLPTIEARYIEVLKIPKNSIITK